VRGSPPAGSTGIVDKIQLYTRMRILPHQGVVVSTDVAV